MPVGSEPLFPTADIKEAALAFVNDSARQTEQPAGPSTATYEEAPAPHVAAAPAKPAPVAPQQTQSQTVQASAPESVTAEVAELSPTQSFRVTTIVDGKPVTEVLTGKQIADRNMNARKFTQSMQQVRQVERQALEAQRGIAAIRQRQAEQEQLLNDPGRLAAYVQGKFPHLLSPQQQAQQQAQHQLQQPFAQQQQQVPAVDPQMLASVGDVNHAVAQSIAQQEAELGRRLNSLEQGAIQRAEESAARVVQQTISNLRNAHQVATFDRQIDDHITSLTSEHPVLSAIPQLNDLLRFEVSKLNPRTPQEMFEGLREVASAYAETIDAHYSERHATTLAAKAKLGTHGVEAPSGQTAQIQPVSRKPFTHNGKGDWDSMKAEAMARLNFK
jgi:hypothetical protein